MYLCAGVSSILALLRYLQCRVRRVSISFTIVKFHFLKSIYWPTVNVFDSVIFKMLHLSKFIFSLMPLHVELIIENWQQSYHLQPNFILNIV